MEQLEHVSPRSNPLARWAEELGTAPVVLRGKALEQKYCGNVLLPVQRFVNGYPAWSAADGSLHLYRSRHDNSWIIRAESLKPDEDNCSASVKAAKGAPPPAGETRWVVSKSLLDPLQLAWQAWDAAAGHGPASLTLLLGSDARAAVSRQQVSARTPSFLSE